MLYLHNNALTGNLPLDMSGMANLSKCVQLWTDGWNCILYCFGWLILAVLSFLSGQFKVNDNEIEGTIPKGMGEASKLGE